LRSGNLATALLLLGALFAGMLFLAMVGRRLGRAFFSHGGTDQGQGAIEGALFALLGLLIAFTFSGAASRFDSRRDLIVAEANALSTAYARLDLLAPEARHSLQIDLRAYLDARLALYAAVGDDQAIAHQLDVCQRLQTTIWTKAVDGAAASPITGAPVLVLPSLNEAFDLATTRLFATTIHPPPVIFAMLGGLALVTALFAGFAMGRAARQSLLHLVGFALIVTLTTYVIVDLEFPRLGLIRIETADRVLYQLRDQMR
jgi:hypothetical protein